jgi:hypothetical protein
MAGAVYKIGDASGLATVGQAFSQHVAGCSRCR